MNELIHEIVTFQGRLQQELTAKFSLIKVEHSLYKSIITFQVNVPKDYIGEVRKFVAAYLKQNPIPLTVYKIEYKTTEITVKDSD